MKGSWILDFGFWIASSLAAASVVLADTPRATIEAGNALYQAGKFTEALETYNRVPDPPPDLITPDWLHNRAAASFKLGQYELARDLWVRAAGLRDAKFEAMCRYNLGNVSYQEALGMIGAGGAASQPVTRPATTPPADDAGAPPAAPVPLNQVIERLDAAIGQYRDSLRLDPQLVDARANIELAEQLKKQLKEQATSQPQSQPSPEEQDKQQQDQNQQDQNSSQPSSQPENQEGSQSQPSSQPQSQPSSQPQSQPSEDQQPESQPSEEQSPESQQSESQPAPESQPASQPQPQPTSQPESQPSGDGQEQQAMPINMSKEEFDRLLQKVRDAEKARRALLKSREAAKHRPVEKDW